MKADTLAFRISRRAVGSAGLDGEGLGFADRRYLSSNGKHAIEAACQYARRLVSELRPETVALFAPTTTDGVTRAIANRLGDELAAQGVAVEAVEPATLMAAFGVTPLRSRADLHRTVLDIWPESEGQTRRRSEEVSDAAAVALLAQVRNELRSAA